MRRKRKGRKTKDILFYSFQFYLFIFTLQYCIGFAIHESAMGVHVFPILNLPPHPIPQGHLSAPALSTLSCIKPGLVIYFTYGNIHVSMLFSQIVPPSPSPTESKSLFFTSVSLLLSLI